MSYSMHSTRKRENAHYSKEYDITTTSIHTRRPLELITQVTPTSLVYRKSGEYFLGKMAIRSEWFKRWWYMTGGPLGGIYTLNYYWRNKCKPWRESDLIKELLRLMIDDNGMLYNKTICWCSNHTITTVHACPCFSAKTHLRVWVWNNHLISIASR